MGEGHVHPPEAMPRADQDLELLKKHCVPLHFRDTCAHLLIPLNECRVETFSLPSKCQPERHIYEECQYIAWKARVAAKKNQTAEAAKAAAAAATV